jgi:hypothetical protein
VPEPELSNNRDIKAINGVISEPQHVSGHESTTRGVVEPEENSPHAPEVLSTLSKDAAESPQPIALPQDKDELPLTRESHASNDATLEVAPVVAIASTLLAGAAVTSAALHLHDDEAEAEPYKHHDTGFAGHEDETSGDVEVESVNQQQTQPDDIQLSTPLEKHAEIDQAENEQAEINELRPSSPLEDHEQPRLNEPAREEYSDSDHLEYEQAEIHELQPSIPHEERDEPCHVEHDQAEIHELQPTAPLEDVESEEIKRSKEQIYAQEEEEEHAHQSHIDSEEFQSISREIELEPGLTQPEQVMPPQLPSSPIDDAHHEPEYIQPEEASTHLEEEDGVRLEKEPNLPEQERLQADHASFESEPRHIHAEEEHVDLEETYVLPEEDSLESDNVHVQSGQEHPETLLNPIQPEDEHEQPESFEEDHMQPEEHFRVEMVDAQPEEEQTHPEGEHSDHIEYNHYEENKTFHIDDVSEQAEEDHLNLDHTQLEPQNGVRYEQEPLEPEEAIVNDNQHEPEDIVPGPIESDFAHYAPVQEHHNEVVSDLTHTESDYMQPPSIPEEYSEQASLEQEQAEHNNNELENYDIDDIHPDQAHDEPVESNHTEQSLSEISYGETSYGELQHAELEHVTPVHVEEDPVHQHVNEYNDYAGAGYPDYDQTDHEPLPSPNTSLVSVDHLEPESTEHDAFLVTTVNPVSEHNQDIITAREVDDQPTYSEKLELLMEDQPEDIVSPVVEEKPSAPKSIFGSWGRTMRSLVGAKPASAEKRSGSTDDETPLMLSGNDGDEMEDESFNFTPRNLDAEFEFKPRDLDAEREFKVDVVPVGTSDPVNSHDLNQPDQEDVVKSTDHSIDAINHASSAEMPEQIDASYINIVPRQESMDTEENYLLEDQPSEKDNMSSVENVEPEPVLALTEHADGGNTDAVTSIPMETFHQPNLSIQEFDDASTMPGRDVFIPRSGEEHSHVDVESLDSHLEHEAHNEAVDETALDVSEPSFAETERNLVVNDQDVLQGTKLDSTLLNQILAHADISTGELQTGLPYTTPFIEGMPSTETPFTRVSVSAVKEPADDIATQQKIEVTHDEAHAEPDGDEVHGVYEAADPEHSPQEHHLDETHQEFTDMSYDLPHETSPELLAHHSVDEAGLIRQDAQVDESQPPPQDNEDAVHYEHLTDVEQQPEMIETVVPAAHTQDTEVSTYKHIPRDLVDEAQEHHDIQAREHTQDHEGMEPSEDSSEYYSDVYHEDYISPVHHESQHNIDGHDTQHQQYDTQHDYADEYHYDDTEPMEVQEIHPVAHNQPHSQDHVVVFDQYEAQDPSRSWESRQPYIDVDHVVEGATYHDVTPHQYDYQENSNVLDSHGIIAEDYLHAHPLNYRQHSPALVDDSDVDPTHLDAVDSNLGDDDISHPAAEFEYGHDSLAAELHRASDDDSQYELEDEHTTTVHGADDLFEDDYQSDEEEYLAEGEDEEVEYYYEDGDLTVTEHIVTSNEIEEEDEPRTAVPFDIHSEEASTQVNRSWADEVDELAQSQSLETQAAAHEHHQLQVEEPIYVNETHADELKEEDVRDEKQSTPVIKPTTSTLTSEISPLLLRHGSVSPQAASPAPPAPRGLAASRHNPARPATPPSAALTVAQNLVTPPPPATPVYGGAYHDESFHSQDDNTTRPSWQEDSRLESTPQSMHSQSTLSSMSSSPQMMPGDGAGIDGQHVYIRDSWPPTAPENNTAPGASPEYDPFKYDIKAARARWEAREIAAAAAAAAELTASDRGSDTSSRRGSGSAPGALFQKMRSLFESAPSAGPATLDSPGLGRGSPVRSRPMSGIYQPPPPPLPMPLPSSRWGGSGPRGGRDDSSEGWTAGGSLH